MDSSSDYSDCEDLISASEDDYSSSESESDDDTLNSARNWCPIDIHASTPAPPNFQFTSTPGINPSTKILLGNTDDPMMFFSIFFDEKIMSFIVEETNRYAEDFFNKSDLTPSSRALNWKNTDIKELNLFLGLLLLQGMVSKSVEAWYWSKRPILSTPFFGQIMSEKRYGLLMKFLHFENSDKFDKKTHPNPKLRKIFDIHEMLVQKFKSAYTPNQSVAIDESLVAFIGLLGWKQYIPTKRARFGLKFFQLCESESGYIWNSIIYTGKGTIFMEEYEHYGLSTKCVLTLIHELKNNGYLLTTDNFYTSPEVAEILLKYKTDVIGTVRGNRKGLPAEFKTLKLKKGEIKAFQKGKIMVLQWRDKKTLTMLSTIHNAELVSVESRKSTTKQKP
ncbi:PiggyBac transposable element-derived protein 4, partial [Araneus ventricosus]